MANLAGTPYTIVYQGKDITEDIAYYVESIGFNDDVDGKSSDVTITVNDKLGKWKQKWKVYSGSSLQLSIRSLNCGTFQVDDAVVRGAPDTVDIKALATGYSTQLRTKRSQSHENKRLGEIVDHVAKRHKLKVIGTPADILINHSSQHRETDLHYLHRMAKKYGHIVSVRRNTLTFMPIYGVQQQDTPAVLDKRDMAAYRFHDAFSKTYNSAKVKYHHPVQCKLIEANVGMKVKKTRDGVLLCTPDKAARNYQRLYRNGVPRNDSDPKNSADSFSPEFFIDKANANNASIGSQSATYANNHYTADAPKISNSQIANAHGNASDLAAKKNANQVGNDFSASTIGTDILNKFFYTKPDMLVIKDVHVENVQQAQEVAKAALFNANTENRTGWIRVRGSEYYVAGNNIKLTGFGLYSGMYTITHVNHTLDNSGGWVCTIDLKMMATTVRPQKPKPKVTAASAHYVDDAHGASYRGGSPFIGGGRAL